MKHNIINLVLDIVNRITTYYYCAKSGLPYNGTWYIRGKILIKKRSYISTHILNNKNGILKIGDNFQCVSKAIYNPLGLIQPCLFNIGASEGELIIGNNVGISGSTICATKSVHIGDNVMIGTGCLITDSDIHPILPQDRLINDEDKVSKRPVRIEHDVFIGARSIVLKGVTIGHNSVIGAGSVVSTNIPSNVVAAGNPAKVIKKLDML